jgi:hypothetical protein
MIRAKMLAVLAGMVATLAITAAPALAEFQSNSSATKGVVKVGAITIEGGGATLTCTSAEGTWTILSGGVASTKGKEERLAFEKFVGCTVKSSLINGAPATVSPCTLAVEQGLGSSKAIGGIVGTCKVEVKVLGTCTITASGTGLKEVNLTNVGNNNVINANVGGITSKPSAACFGVKETKEAKEKAVATAEGQKWV